MTRYSAFAIHLGISFLIFLLLAYFVVFEWYPSFFFESDGGWRGIRIIVAVDMVLGPLLTLVVFKAGKPGLKTDLTLIGLLQFVCLFAGAYVVWSERPLAIVYVDSRFEVLTRDDFKTTELGSSPDLSAYPGDSPKWIAVAMPQDITEQTAFRKKMFGSGRTLSTATQHYKPFDPTDPLFTDDPRDMDVVRKREGGEKALNDWVKEHGGNIEDYNFYTYSTRYAYRYMGFSKSSGEMIGFLSIQPR
ncbi:MAG: hypothetical protein GXP16_01885 [Gammaproteobacteria bacterium]|nr:hypothetical protein [Gammaproteobacteria bacterium]